MSDRPLLDLSWVEREWQGCERCGLATGTVVNWRGAPGSRLLLIGEGPGREEDEQGKPFVGPAGELLDDLYLRAIGIPIASSAIVINMVGCRPPGNRVPKALEIRACKPRVDDLLRATSPLAALLMGATALRWFGGRQAKLTDVRGETLSVVRPVEGQGGDQMLFRNDVVELSAVPTWHPAYILRLSERVRRQAEDEFIEDLRTAAKLGGEYL